MTLRELIRDALGCERSIDVALRARIVDRDESGCVTTVRHVRIVRFFGDGELVIEAEDLDNAKKEQS